jgi:uncharacterized protein
MAFEHLRAAYSVEEFKCAAAPVVAVGRIDSMDRFIQHGTTSTLDHTLAVSYYCMAAASRFGMRCAGSGLLRAAILHDYFLYDWHEAGDGSHRLHGFRHPRFALQNASDDFDLSEIEADAILHHMFPLVPVPPRHAAGWLICCIDKLCSLRETFVRDPYPEFGKDGPAAFVCGRSRIWAPADVFARPVEKAVG